MDVAAILKLGQLLLQLGPVFAKEVAAIKAAGTATEADQAALDAQIETLNSQRTESWAAADVALDAVIAKG